jgi:hypothetical protein
VFGNKNKAESLKSPRIAQWDNAPPFVKFNPGLLDLLVLLDKACLQTGISQFQIEVKNSFNFFYKIQF